MKYKAKVEFEFNMDARGDFGEDYGIPHEKFYRMPAEKRCALWLLKDLKSCLPGDPVKILSLKVSRR